MSAEQQTRTRQPNFARLLRKDKDTYEQVRKLVQYLATSTEQEFDHLWSFVTDRDENHFRRHFRRQRRKNDPFSGIKNAVPAYSFFTQEWNSKIAAEKGNEGKSFGEISKLVGQKWKNLPAKDKAKYEKLAAKDKKRYQDEIEQRSREMTTNTAVEQASVSQDESGDAHEEEAVPTETESAPVAKPSRKRAARK